MKLLELRKGRSHGPGFKSNPPTQPRSFFEEPLCTIVGKYMNTLLYVMFSMMFVLKIWVLSKVFRFLIITNNRQKFTNRTFINEDYWLSYPRWHINSSVFPTAFNALSFFGKGMLLTIEYPLSPSRENGNWASWASFSVGEPLSVIEALKNAWK